jgi:hypothetical protein
MFTGVAAKSPKLVQNLCFRGHDYLWNFFGTYQEIFNVPLRTNLIGAAYFGFGPAVWRLSSEILVDGMECRKGLHDSRRITGPYILK